MSKARLRQLEAAAAQRLGRGERSAVNATDDELAERIGGPGCLAADLADEDLMRLRERLAAESR